MKRNVYLLVFLAIFLVNTSTAQAKFGPSECTTLKRIVAFKDAHALKFLKEAIHLDQFVPGVKDRAVKKLTDEGGMFNIEPGTLMKMIDWANRQMTSVVVRLPDGRKVCILRECLHKERGQCDCRDE